MMGTPAAATPSIPSMQWHRFSQNTQQELNMVYSQQHQNGIASASDVNHSTALQAEEAREEVGPGRLGLKLDLTLEDTDGSSADGSEDVPLGVASSADVAKSNSASPSEPSIGVFRVTISTTNSPELGAYAFPDSPTNGNASRRSASYSGLEPQAPSPFETNPAHQVQADGAGRKEQHDDQKHPEANLGDSVGHQVNATCDAATSTLPPQSQQTSAATASATGDAPGVVQTAQTLNPLSSPAAKLAKYRGRVEELKLVKQAKPDMVAYKELNGKLTKRWHIGHIPDVPVGFEVNGKGELAILGIHCDINKGIYSKGDNPAFAIALSGGYADDDDTGETFEYTGMGGQKNGIQVSDQKWANCNLALQRSFQQQTPVRVVRRKLDNKSKTNTMPVYCYEGLYRVAEARMEEGIHGKQVCKFRMEAIPGESKVSLKVESRVRHFKKVNLAQRTDTCQGSAHASASTRRPAAKKRKISEHRAGMPKAKTARLDLQPVQSEQSAPVKDIKLLDDFSKGMERIKIPVYGQHKDDLKTLVQDFTYVRASVLDPGAPERMDEWGRAAFEWKDGCGIQAMGGKPYLTEKGLLTETLEWGLFECCDGCTAKECRASRVVSRGISLPLQIFRTRNAGWGMRCATFIPIGAFVCEYSGAIMTDAEAETRSGEYLFDLDHFVAMHRMARETPNMQHSPGKLIPKLPDDLRQQDLAQRDLHLSIDAESCGNAGRFINHSCNGNLVVQTVFTQGSTVLNYRVAFFALRDIPALTELTYDYMWRPTQNVARELWCKCGEPNCVGRLL